MVKLICLLAVLQSFVVDKFIYEVQFNLLQGLMGALVLVLAGLTLSWQALVDQPTNQYSSRKEWVILGH